MRGGYSFMDSRGRGWELDGDGLYLLIRAAVRARAIRQRSRRVEHSAGWGLPTTYQIETNWQGLRAEVDRLSEPLFQGIYRDAQVEPESSFNQLRMMVEETRNDILWMRDQQQSAQQDTTRSIDSCVTGWSRAVDVARFVRDASATILVVGAGVMSGGAAMATLGAGSALRGTATYQDTGNVGAAMVQATGTFLVGAIPLGAGGGAAGGAALMSRAAPAASTGATVIIVQSGFAGGSAGLQSLVEGNNMRNAAAQAAAAAGLNLVTAGLGDRIGGMTFAARITIGSAGDAMANAATSAAGSWAGGARPGASPASSAGARSAAAIPRVSGQVDVAGVPLQPGQEAAFVREYCLRPMS